MITQKIEPPVHLRKFIKTYLVQFIKDVDTTHVIIPAWTQNFFFFQFRDFSDMKMLDHKIIKGHEIMITGCMTQATTFVTDKKMTFASIVAELQPFTLYSMFKKNISFLTDSSISGDAVFSNHEHIMAELKKDSSVDAKLDILNSFFSKFFANMDYTSHEVIDKAIDEFDQPLDESFNIGNFTNKFQLSERHFRRLFEERTGISPKLYYRIRRLEHILSELYKNPDQKYMSLLKDYVDQSHFIKDFKRFTGKKTSELLELFKDSVIKDTFNNL